MDKESAKSNAAGCREALNKLRKLRKAKRAEPGEEGVPEEEGDPEDVDMDEDSDVSAADDLGPKSSTFKQDESEFFSWEDADEFGIDIFGSVGLNQCTGVLIIGDGGVLGAHLSPIEAKDEPEEEEDPDDMDEDDQEDANEEMEEEEADDDSKAAFAQEVTDKVENLFHQHQDKLANAYMWIMTPSTNLGEAEICEAAADRLGCVGKKTVTYDVVADETLDEDDYIEEERGTFYANFADRQNVKAFINGDETGR